MRGLQGDLRLRRAADKERVGIALPVGKSAVDRRGGLFRIDAVVEIRVVETDAEFFLADLVLHRGDDSVRTEDGAGAPHASRSGRVGKGLAVVAAVRGKESADQSAAVVVRDVDFTREEAVNVGRGVRRLGHLDVGRFLVLCKVLPLADLVADAVGDMESAVELLDLDGDEEFAVIEFGRHRHLPVEMRAAVLVADVLAVDRERAVVICVLRTDIGRKGLAAVGRNDETGLGRTVVLVIPELGDVGRHLRVVNMDLAGRKPQRRRLPDLPRVNAGLARPSDLVVRADGGTLDIQTAKIGIVPIPLGRADGVHAEDAAVVQYAQIGIHRMKTVVGAGERTVPIGEFVVGGVPKHLRRVPAVPVGTRRIVEVLPVLAVHPDHQIQVVAHLADARIERLVIAALFGRRRRKDGRFPKVVLERSRAEIVGGVVAVCALGIQIANGGDRFRRRRVRQQHQQR